MGLTEDLQRLAQLRDAGELSPEQYEAEKNRLLDVAVVRIENCPNKRGTPLITRRAIRGSVKSIDFSRLKNTVTLWIGTRKITIERIGKPIRISAGDRVLVVASTDGENIQANLYINETNGDESVSEWRKATRKVIWAGVAMTLGALAVLITVVLAALRETTLFSIGAIARTPIYAISIAAALALGALAIFLLALGTLRRSEIQMIDREHLKSRELL